MHMQLDFGMHIIFPSRLTVYGFNANINVFCQSNFQYTNESENQTKWKRK